MLEEIRVMQYTRRIDYRGREQVMLAGGDCDWFKHLELRTRIGMCWQMLFASPAHTKEQIGMKDLRDTSQWLETS